MTFRGLTERIPGPYEGANSNSEIHYKKRGESKIALTHSTYSIQYNIHIVGFWLGPRLNVCGSMFCQTVTYTPTRAHGVITQKTPLNLTTAYYSRSIRNMPRWFTSFWSINLFLHCYRSQPLGWVISFSIRKHCWIYRILQWSVMLCCNTTKNIYLIVITIYVLCRSNSSQALNLFLIQILNGSDDGA
jgi:hypothetical protein